MLNQYLFDGHGHSLASDGLNTPAQIISHAQANGLNIIALTDHNSVANLANFIDAGKNSSLLTIPGIELSCTEGDLLIYLPNEKSAEQCIKSFRKPLKRPHMLATIEMYIELYDALFVIPHPACAYISSASLNFIEQLMEQLPAHYRNRVAVEAHNWMSKIFFWRRIQEEKAILKLANTLQIATTAGTDYHLAVHTGKHRTICYMSELTTKAFVEAFIHKQLHPAPLAETTFSDLSSIGYASFLAEINSITKGHSYRISKES